MIALYLFGALLLALLVGVVLAPLLTGGDSAEFADLSPERQREAALEAIRELEFERETEKVSDAEYRRLRAHYAGLIESAAPEPGDAPEAVCTSCGEELGPAARFCPNCGSPRDESRAAEDPGRASS